ncbi:MAG TPA: patatin-like protein [Thermoanaerobaculia bacterium]|jgi:patatin-related protein|nr:patatin-like protein [Thermoanaerobaculia bacterium]
MPETNVRELRLGLVCYGGVSLAIYMHGMTKELQKLVVASRALEDDPETNPFPPASSEHAYWQVLKTAQERSKDHALTRVVIDVVAGTSAGGINGIILCKALAHNLSQDALRDLWFERGDIEQLLGGSRFKEVFTAGHFLLDLFRNKAEPPLKGQAMLGWLYDALKAMDGTSSGYRPKTSRGSLMPDGHPLQLFVTTTDYYGYRQYMTIDDPPTVTERRNRHVFNFNYDRTEGTDQFDPSHNGALALACRATSSFPGAFPPVHLDDARDLHLPAGFQHEFFSAYEQSGADASKTYFIDGGVLNNYPFRPAINAIVKLRAESEVSRYLLYLQPDPGSEQQNPTGEPPNFFGSIWAGLSSVAASQPILEELVAARSFNERVRRIDELVASTQEDVAGILKEGLTRDLGDKLAAAESAQLARERDRLDAEAERRGDYLYDPYLQIRAHSIVEQFAFGICQVCNYKEEESNLAFLIRLVVDCWAQSRRLIGADVDRDKRSKLLNQFDLGYTRRRFAFVLQRINHFYAEKDAPSRRDLDRAKIALYNRIDALRALSENSSGDLRGTLAPALIARFPPTLGDEVAKGLDLQAFARRFVDQHGDEMDGLVDRLSGFLRDQKNLIHHGLYEDFRDITAQWTPAQREEVMLRYLGFPFWDAMIYPAIRLSEAGELRPLEIVRMSPNDSTRLGSSTAHDKLKGVAVAHFGAFLHRDWRENDYLWGRLDAAERLVGLVLRAEGGQAGDWDVKPVLAAVLAEEEKALTSVKPLVAELQKKVAALPGAPPAAGK